MTGDVDKMSRLPRLALATPGLGPEPAPASLALLAGLTAAGLRVQHFRTRSCPIGSELIRAITGLPGRHLDAWLMPPPVCRGIFARGLRQAELALIEGTLEDPHPQGHRCGADVEVGCTHPGRLGPIAEALDAPTIALIDCPSLEGLHLPRLPNGIDAVLLDGLIDPEQFGPIRSMFQHVLRKPVLGAIEALPEVRRALLSVPRHLSPTLDLIEPLAASFKRFVDLDALKLLAVSRPFPELPCPAGGCRSRRLRVAYAQDEAFGGYFPDTLETLEALGAELVEFSPLADESLPEAVDLVIIGCGYPDRFQDELAANLSLTAALRAHVCRGLRIYAEGGGAAYLARMMIVEGRAVPGAGILPFDAELREQPDLPSPVERTLNRDTWLGRRGTVVRGYDSGRWRLRPAPEPGDCPARSGPLTASRDLYYRRNAIGSLVHLHLAALPDVVAAFLGLPRPSLIGPPSMS
ncbi:cobyrinate a,c-diamide synthase [soil metagenome]